LWGGVGVGLKGVRGLVRLVWAVPCLEVPLGLNRQRPSNLREK